MLDIIIKNATVVDGTGTAAFTADIAVQGDKITDIGNIDPAEAKLTIDASGMLVCPGFIDSHSHSDEAYIVNPLAESKLRQGITTEVVGNCGSSPFPLSDEVRERYQEDVKNWGLVIDWTSAEEYFHKVQDAKPAVNIVPLVGQGTLRAAVLGYDNRPPKPDEMQKMKDLLREALQSGCWGFSTGLIYPPGCFSTLDELAELATSIKPLGGFYTSHIRSEGDTLIEAIEEAISIARASGVAAEIAHLKAAGVRNWGKAELAINIIMDAREKEGLDIGFDRYPYTASSTGLSSLLPEWAHAGGHKKTVEFIADPDTSNRLLDEMEANLEGQHGWQSVILANAATPDFEQFEGLSISEIANVKGVSPAILAITVMLKSKFNASICSFTMSKPETDMILNHPLCAVCTDATARATTGPLSKGKPHPRTFGSFPKFFRNYVKESRTLTLPEAVARTTALPAERFGINQRGILKPGYYADILIIDWESFTDTATYDNPISLALGLNCVIVNGGMVFNQEKYTGTRSGRILTPSRT